MYHNHRCDCCQKSMCTRKLWVNSSYSINTQIDLCTKCFNILETEEFQKIADFVLIRDKVRFLRNDIPDNDFTED